MIWILFWIFCVLVVFSVCYNVLEDVILDNKSDGIEWNSADLDDEIVRRSKDVEENGDKF